MIIKTDGSLWGWGWNSYGQLGDGTTDNRSYPKKIMDNVAVVVANNSYTMAVKTDGTLWQWGLDYNSGYPYESHYTPVKIMDNVTSVSTNYGFTMVIKTDKSLWGWGNGYYEPIGDGTNEKRYVPVKIMDDVAAVNILHGGKVMAIKSNGSLWVWGAYWYEMWQNVLDWNSSSNSSIIAPIKVMDNVAQVSGEYSHSLIVKADGTLWAFGTNTYGKLGNGGGNDESDPIQIVGFNAKVSSNIITSAFTDVPAPASPTKFTDVTASSPFVDAINWAVEKNITTGKTDSTFAPGEECTNGQILTFLWRANGSPEPTIDNPFTDSIPVSFQKSAVWAYEKGLVSGAVFGASTPCTRALTVEYLWKAAGSPATSGNASFADVPANADYAQAVAWAVENGVTSGTGNGQFSPANTCTRGQIMTFLYRAMGK